MNVRQFFNELASEEEDENDDISKNMFKYARKEKLSSRFVQNEDDFDNKWSAHLAEPVINKMNYPLLWWNDNKSRFPKLALRAQGLLAIPPTTVPIEKRKAFVRFREYNYG